MRTLTLQRTFGCQPGNSSVNAEKNSTKRDFWGVYSKYTYMSSCQIQLKMEGVRGSGVGAGWGGGHFVCRTSRAW